MSIGRFPVTDAPIQLISTIEASNRTAGTLITNTGASAVYVDSSSTVSPTNSQIIVPGSSVQWDEGLSAFAVCSSGMTSELVLTNNVGSITNPSLDTGSVLVYRAPRVYSSVYHTSPIMDVRAFRSLIIKSQGLYTALTGTEEPRYYRVIWYSGLDSPSITDPTYTDVFMELSLRSTPMYGVGGSYHQFRCKGPYVQIIPTSVVDDADILLAYTAWGSYRELQQDISYIGKGDFGPQDVSGPTTYTDDDLVTAGFHSVSVTLPIGVNTGNLGTGPAFAVPGVPITHIAGPNTVNFHLSAGVPAGAANPIRATVREWSTGRKIVQFNIVPGTAGEPTASALVNLPRTPCYWEFKNAGNTIACTFTGTITSAKV